jgi:hypothetical protein
MAMVVVRLAAAAPGAVSFSPDTIAIGPNDTVDVSIRVDADVSDIHCFRMLVDSVESGIRLVNVVEGPLLSSGGSTFFFWKDTLGGYDIFSCLLGPGLHADGPGVLATMTFVSGASPCGTALVYTYVLVQNTLLDSLPIAHHNGQFSVPSCCQCPCHGDPLCDGVATVQDVVLTVGVAFRGQQPLIDPDCPRRRSDVNCDDVTTVIDVVKMVNVAFRSENPMVQFCRPCP